MDNETAKRSKIAPCELLPNLVLEIMSRLPVKSLLRFRCVCKAWRHTISVNAAFRIAHFRAQKPRLLVWTSTREDRRNKVTTIGLHVSEESAALADTMDLPHEDDAHCFAHCDGLVLVPTETVLCVVNLATRCVLPLPPSSNSVATDRFYKLLTHQVFGIGYDPRSDTYKVARFFFGHMDPVRGGYHHNFGMEVFTIGVDQHWREMALKPPYPADILRNPTFFKDSLFWPIDQNKLTDGESAPGFLRLRLEDESFSVTPPPPCCTGLIYATSYLGELHGELSVAHPGPKYESIEIWMCNDVETNQPRWTRHHIFSVYCPPTT